jgi:MFS family permease
MKNTDNNPRKIIFYLPFLLVLVAYTSATIPSPLSHQMILFMRDDGFQMNAIISRMFLCFSVSALLLGSIADLCGRKNILIFCNLLALIGSAITMLSYSPITYVLGLCIMGMGLGAYSVIARTSIRDNAISNAYLIKSFAALSLMMAMSPLIAHHLALFVPHVLSWRAVYSIICFSSLILMLISIFKMKRDKLAPVSLSQVLRQTLNGLLFCLSNRTFIFNSMSAMLAASIYIGIFMGLLARLLLIVYGVSMLHYSICCFLITGSYIAGILIVFILPPSMRNYKFILLTYLIALIGVGLIFYSDALIIFFVGMCLTSIGVGTLTPLIAAASMRRISKNISVASAVIAALLMLFCAIWSYAFSLLHLSTLDQLRVTLSIGLPCSFIFFLLGNQK